MPSPADRTWSRPALRHLVTKLPARALELILTALIGSRGLQALEIGTFRQTSGQASYRMYDRYSLEQLFLSAGFPDVLLRTAKESACAFWDEVNLDISAEGQAVKPHVLIMEGIRAS